MIRYRGQRGGVPGPCPVDDAPHTTCTSADYTPTTQIVTTTLRRPRTLPPPVNPPPAAPVAFTSGTYARKLHGPRDARGKVKK